LSTKASDMHDDDAMKLTFTLPAEEEAELKQQLKKPNDEGFKEVVDFSFGINVEGARCARVEDEEMIDELIEKGYNNGLGCKKVNRVVRERLLKWVAKTATSGTKEKVEALMERHKRGWYNERVWCKCGLEPDKCKCEMPKYQEEIDPAIDIQRAVDIKRALRKPKEEGSKEANPIMLQRAVNRQRALTEAGAAWRVTELLHPELISMGSANDELMDRVGIDIAPDNTAKVHPR